MGSEMCIRDSYYSRTGVTRTLAESIHRRIGGELVEIKTSYYREGILGYLQAVLDATLKRIIPISYEASLDKNYDLVVIGTPVWNASLSSPIQTLMSHSLPKTKQVAFFLTHGGSGAKRVFQQLESLYGKSPIAQLNVTTTEVLKRNFTAKLEKFIQDLTPSKKEIQRAA